MRFVLEFEIGDRRYCYGGGVLWIEEIEEEIPEPIPASDAEIDAFLATGVAEAYGHIKAAEARKLEAEVGLAEVRASKEAQDLFKASREGGEE